MKQGQLFLKSLIALAFPLAVLLSLPAFSVEYETTAHVLSNGLKVLVLERHSAPVVAIQVWYRVGSQHESQGVRGIAHLFEHMMFRGSANYGPEDHHRLINEMGGETNAYTFFDRTVYHQQVPPRALELVLKLEADRMYQLTLNQEILDTEREVVKEEYHLYKNNPFFELLTQALPAVYPNHPYGLTPLGRIEDINRFTLEDCEQFYNHYYAPNNAVLVIVGDVDTVRCMHLCNQSFGGIPIKAIPSPPDLTIASRKGPGPYKLKGPIPVRVTAAVFYIPEAGHPDTIPLQVLAQILSAGESSRLHRSLVIEQELAMAALGYPLVAQGPGVFACAAVHLPNISSKKVDRAILKEVNRLKTEDVSDEELEKARKQLLAAKIFERYSADGLAASLGFAEVIQGDYRRFEKELDEFRNVTAADIRRVANDYFSETNKRVLYFKPKHWNPLIWAYGVVKALF